ncbi:MAG: SRPBCC domain-containing protein [Antarcticimicrobium sp.]|uniref:SRPBCC domain-containing protein n=1 Tax=Antarcticimicrobium sp. TaxID=2824147 RepID=UPI00263A2799|nr:SRPBCC domain-containing protein [Antarcticimicrobium sp.]MDF1717131.1 SRPBCC domain-containing protein [Antarcticimicrobium sp.]
MSHRTLSLLALPGLMLGACTTLKQVDTRIEIDAPPCEVYATLVDFDGYADWNPYHVRVAGSGVVGDPLEVRVSRPDGAVVDVPHVRLLEATPCRSLVWGGGIRGVFRGEHRFDLHERADGGTHLSHTEVFSGLFIGFADLPVAVLTEGYNRTNEALRAAVER